MEKNRRLLELINQKLSAVKINKILQQEYGSGIRKKTLLKKMREELSIPPRDTEKYIPKKYIDKKYMLITISSYIEMEDGEEVINFAYKKALNKRKDELKKLIKDILLAEKESKGEKSKEYYKFKKEMGSKEEIEKAMIIEKNQDTHISSKMFALSQEKNILAYIYAAAKTLKEIKVSRIVKEVELFIGKKLV